MFKSSLNLYNIEWLDLVFKNRNQNYGAYVLRKNASSTLLKSLGATVVFFALLIGVPFMLAKLNPMVVAAKTKVTIVDLSTKIHELKKNDPKVEKAALKEIKAEPKIKSIAVSSSIVVVEEPKTPPPTVVDMKNAVIASVTQTGIEGQNVGVANANSAATTSEVAVVDNEILDLNAGGVDEFPEFVGGMKNFSKFIQRNLHFPIAAQEAEVQGKVYISFVVERDGSVSNVTLMRGIGFGCDEEALRVIQKSPIWKPGKNKGVPVRVRYQVPINFTMAY